MFLELVLSNTYKYTKIQIPMYVSTNIDVEQDIIKEIEIIKWRKLCEEVALY